MNANCVSLDSQLVPIRAQLRLLLGTSVNNFPNARVALRLGGIAMLRVMLRYILTSELRHAVSLVHHENDQLCIFRPSLAARERAISERARLYYFSGSDALGNGGHSYGHFVESGALPAHAGGLCA